MADPQNPVAEFMRLFVGNDRSYGRFIPSSGKMSTVAGAYTFEAFRQHLIGNVGIGIVPVLDNGNCRFAAIDIDAHGNDEAPIDCVGLAQRVQEKELPLVVCHSKGRGAHLYCFFTEDVPASAARATLARWSIELGHPGAEVFPKQTALPVLREGQRALGNWINLPYFAGDTRLAVDGGKDVDLEYFLELARTRSCSLEQFERVASHEHADAPPCVQRMILEGVPFGENVRNNGFTQACIYLKKAYPDNWKNRAFDFNAAVLKVPLKHDEAEKTVKSVGTRDYNYFCDKEPMRSLCDRKACLTRKHGISQSDGPALEDLPEFSDLIKIGGDPVRWQMSVNGIPMYYTTGELGSFAHVQMRIFETLHVWIRDLDKRKWKQILNALSTPDKLRLVEVPDEVGKHGSIWARLVQYLGQARDTGEDQRNQLLRDLAPPSIIHWNGTNPPSGKYIAFSINSFRDHLRRQRLDGEVREGVDVAYILRSRGVQSMRMRIGGALTTIHVIEFDKINSKEEPAPLEPKEEM